MVIQYIASYIIGGLLIIIGLVIIASTIDRVINRRNK